MFSHDRSRNRVRIPLTRTERRSGRATGKREFVAAGFAVVLVFASVACANQGDTGDEDGKAATPCDRIADRLVNTYGQIVEAYRGASIEDFAESGFLGERVANAVTEGSEIQSDAQEEACNPSALLAEVIARGDELEADGAGAVAAKGMLLAQASNAVFYGPGGEGASMSGGLMESREPSNDVSLEDVKAIDFAKLNGCVELSDAKALMIQWMLNELARRGGETPTVTSDELAQAQEGLEAAESRSGCSSFELSKGLIEALDGVEALGFFANVQYGEFVKQAWLRVQEELVKIDVKFKMRARPHVATVGDIVRIDYIVRNAGTVPLANIQLLDLEVQPVVPPIPLLEPGESKTVSETIEMTQEDVPRREIRIELDASDPFGRTTGLGYTSLFVRVHSR